MKRTLLCTLIAILSFAPLALAGHLAPPQNVVCALVDSDGDGVDDAVSVGWDAVEGAKKYSVLTMATYDLDSDGVPDATKNDDFQTKETGATSHLIGIHEFILERDDMFVAPLALSLRVKGVHNGKGPHFLSLPCDVF